MQLGSVVIGVLALAAARPAAADPPRVPRVPRVIDKPVDPIEYTVVDRGAKDGRAVLRHALRAGARAHGTLTLDETSWGIRFPRVTLDVTSEVTSIDRDGKIHFREVVTGVALDPKGSPPEVDVAAMRRAYEPAVGLASEEIIDPRGIASARRLVVPSSSILPYVLDQVGGYLGGLTWLPEEAVGVGAKWRSTYTEVDDDGRTVAHSATIVLVGRRGDRIELEKTSSASGGAQRQEHGLAVTAAIGRGTIRTSTDLGRLAWSWSSTSTSHYRAVRDGVPQDVELIRTSRCTATPDISR